MAGKGETQELKNFAVDAFNSLFDALPYKTNVGADAMSNAATLHMDFRWSNEDAEPNSLPDYIDLMCRRMITDYESVIARAKERYEESEDEQLQAAAASLRLKLDEVKFDELDGCTHMRTSVIIGQLA